MRKFFISPFYKNRSLFSTQQDNPLTSRFYVNNYNESINSKLVKSEVLDDNVKIFKIPFFHFEERDQINKDIDEIIKDETNKINLIQIDPTLHLYKKRIVFQKYQNEVKYKNIANYDELIKTNPIKIMSHSECLLELSIIKSYTKEKIEINPENLQILLLDLMESIFLETKNNNNQNMINLLFQKTLKNEQIYLSFIPSLYHRLLIGNILSLSQLRESFKLILTTCKNTNAKEHFSIVSEMVLSPSLQLTSDIYLRFLLEAIRKENNNKEIHLFQLANSYETFKKYYQISKQEEHEWENTFDMPPNVDGENDNILIEKHALLDLLFETKIWELPYVRNPFPYISEKYEQLKEEEQKNLQKIFYVNYNKYESMKNKYFNNN